MNLLNFNLISLLIIFNFQLICSQNDYFDNELSKSQLRFALSLRANYMQRSLQQYPCMVKNVLEKNAINDQCCEKIPEVSTAKNLFYDPNSINNDVELHNSSPRYKFRMENGIVKVYRGPKNHYPKAAPTIEEYKRDFDLMVNLTLNNGPLKTYCNNRMEMMLSQFEYFTAVQSINEMEEQKNLGRRDLYSIAKVDNHIHGGSVITQGNFIAFAKRKYLTECNTIVYSETNGKLLTLCQLFESEKLKFEDININRLNLHGNRLTRDRFDYFLLQIYKPFGSSKLGKVFLQYDNYIGGRYFAEMLKETIERYEKYNVYSEIRVPIYGETRDQWTKLANWFDTHKLLRYNRLHWAIEIWALSSAGFETNEVKNYEDVLENIFIPLFQVTRDPSSNPSLSRLLQSISVFDNDSGEGLEVSPYFNFATPPKDIKNPADAPYIYQVYYIFSNIVVLNQYRKERGLNLFTHRPHIGETGDENHLISGFLVGQSIQHGFQLRLSPVFQYLYYLAQIGIATAPTSNHYLWADYDTQPFIKLYKLGLLMSINSDNPAQFSQSDYSLWEEYTSVANHWRLSNVDMCEIARNSVIMSNFPHNVKQKLIGDNYNCNGRNSNNSTLTNVPDRRINYRQSIYLQELNLLPSK